MPVHLTRGDTVRLILRGPLHARCSQTEFTLAHQRRATRLPKKRQRRQKRRMAVRSQLSQHAHAHRRIPSAHQPTPLHRHRPHSFRARYFTWSRLLERRRWVPPACVICHCLQLRREINRHHHCHHIAPHRHHAIAASQQGTHTGRSVNPNSVGKFIAHKIAHVA